MNDEEWRPFLGGDYEVSSLGRVRRARPGRCTFAGRVMTLVLQSNGYYKINPVVNGKNVQRNVHDLVAEAFLGPRPDGAVVNHIDGDKTNNAVGNLEYVTHAANMAHAARIGLMVRGENHGNAKLTNEQAQQLRTRRAAGEVLTALAREFGIAVSTASQIVNGQRRSK